MIKIDEVLVDRAVEIGEEIAVIGTNLDMLKLSPQFVLEPASTVGGQVRVEPRVVDLGFDDVRNGCMQTHDRPVRHAISDLAPNLDMTVSHVSNVGMGGFCGFLRVSRRESYVDLSTGYKRTQTKFARSGHDHGSSGPKLC